MCGFRTIRPRALVPDRKQAVTGPIIGTPLNLMAFTHTKGFWKKKHPDTMVLSDRTGYRRDYDRDPYAVTRKGTN